MITLIVFVCKFSSPVIGTDYCSVPESTEILILLFCGMFVVDDARLLLGVYYHGLGNWEKIRLDERLSLFDKLAPQGATASETSVPRSTHLEAHVNALLRKVYTTVLH